MKKASIIIVLVLVFSTLVLAFNLPQKERPDLWDGHDWQSLNYEQKFLYVSGMATGMNIFIKQMFPDEELIDKETVETMIENINNEYKKIDLSTPISDLDIPS